MSASTGRIVVAVVLIAHGLGHVLGILPVFHVKLSRSHSATSWLLTNRWGETASQWVGSILWVTALVLFVGAGLGLLGWLVPHAWWQRSAIAAAAVSLSALVLFWRGFPFFFPNKVGALVVDLAVLLSLLWLEWPTDVVLG